MILVQKSENKQALMYLIAKCKKAPKKRKKLLNTKKPFKVLIAIRQKAQQNRPLIGPKLEKKGCLKISLKREQPIE